MKTIFIIAGLIILGSTGCKQFVNNVESTRYDSTPSGLNENEETQVMEFSEGGQLNETEEKAINEQIYGTGQ